MRETSIGWMLQRITGALDEAMNTRLAALDMNLGTFAVMMTVLEHGPLTQAEIGKRFGMAPYAISRAVDTLEELGFVSRGAHAHSRRAHSITATVEGVAIAPKLHAVVRDVNAALAAPLSAAERETLTALLRKVLPGRDAP
ncbi:MAG: MarR family winged helix-turn-helix transcriptional regulator [Rhodobacter sp.]|nr:MarR family winged helix-turn-helix transcriptional regulator [Rhodobacter sp.]